MPKCGEDGNRYTFPTEYGMIFVTPGYITYLSKNIFHQPWLLNNNVELGLWGIVNESLCKKQCNIDLFHQYYEPASCKHPSHDNITT